MTTNKPEVVAYLSPAGEATMNNVDHVITEAEFARKLDTEGGANQDIVRGAYCVPLVSLFDYEALQAECDALRAKTSLSLGVGDGTGNLFVHGDYDSIKRMQALIFECGKLRKDVDMLVEALEEFSYGLHQTVDGEDDCRCSQCRFIRMRDAALAKVAGRQPMTKSNTEKPKYLYGQRVIVDNDTIAIFRHYENADLAIEALWVELPDGVVQWRSPHNVKPLPGGQL